MAAYDERHAVDGEPDDRLHFGALRQNNGAGVTQVDGPSDS